MPSRAVYRAIWIPSALILGGLTAVFARQPYMIAPPAPLTSFTTSDKTITIRRPGNWKARQTAAHSTLPQVKFLPSRSVSFVITSDRQGSLMADRAKSPGGDTNSAFTDMANGMANGQSGGEQQAPPPPQKSPTLKLHEMQGE